MLKYKVKYRNDLLGLFYLWILVVPQTHFITFYAQDQDTYKYIVLPYFWLGLDSLAESCARKKSLNTQIVLNSKAPLYYLYHPSFYLVIY